MAARCPEGGAGAPGTLLAVDAATIVGVAEALAGEVLFPASLATDAAELLAVDLLDALAEAGLYGLVVPAPLGGLGADPATAAAVVEALASGCLTTAFVWLQHLAASVAVAGAEPDTRDAWVTRLADGRVRAGVAFAHLRRPDPAPLVAAAVEDGWILEGSAPWVSGWGRIDVVHVGARYDDDVVWLLVDAVAGPTFAVTPLPLAAVNASGTVTGHFRGHLVGASRMTRREPLADWKARDAAGLRMNGSLALGVGRRCLALLGPGPLDTELERCRAALDDATAADLPAARASATTFALRMAAALVVATGGRAVLRDQHAQRLAREALFLLVQGQTPEIRAAQAQALRATPPALAP